MVRLSLLRLNYYRNLPKKYFEKERALKEDPSWDRRGFYRDTEHGPWSVEEKQQNHPSKNTLHPSNTLIHAPLPQWQIFRGDVVQILVGRDKGKRGEVCQVVPSRNWCFVFGMNLKFEYYAKYENLPGKMFSKELPLDVVTEVALLDPTDNLATTIEWRHTEQGERVRVSRRTGRIIPIPKAADETYEYKTISTYREEPKDTPAKVASVVTYEPVARTFEEDVMQTSRNNWNRLALGAIHLPLSYLNMTPHKGHRTSSRRDSNTKTMHELVVDIMEMENSGRATSGNKMVERNSGECRIPKWRLSGTKCEGNRRSRKPIDTRKRKDDHNIIERRRRNNINTLIKELRSLLPNVMDTSKGSTLKAAVEYLRIVKKDQEKLKLLETEQKRQELPLKQLMNRVQELEKLLLNQQKDDLPSLPESAPPTELCNSWEMFTVQETDLMAVKQEKEQIPIIREFQYESVVIPDFSNAEYDLNIFDGTASVEENFPELADALMYFDLNEMDEMNVVHLV